jgi:predicted 3-demethylubiquinone-9 3-methyltransferase (glyoxalase superfamily)
MSQKITPFLWFDNQAEEASQFYVSIFKNSEVIDVNRYGEAGPEGQAPVLTTSFRLGNLEFTALNGGPEFQFSPAISCVVGCETEEEIDEIWAKLIDGGGALMALDKYPFSPKFGWLVDKYGLSWQLNLNGIPQAIVPFLTFVGAQHGRAEEAINFYESVFKNSKTDMIARHEGGGAEKEGTVQFASFTLEGQPFFAMESQLDHKFTFTEAISFFVSCKDQAEVDDLWAKLTADGGQPSQCGWLKDKFGVSWQIIPTLLMELIGNADREKANRAMQAMLQMTKIDTAKLQEAFNG